MNFLGEIFATLWSFGWLKGRWMRKSYGHLWDKTGELYMGRWVVIATGTWASRLLWLSTLGKYDHVRLHWIMQADDDRDLHNHPFNYRTFILDGWYTEERRGVHFVRNTGDTAASPLGTYHRIAAVPLSGVWTLFVMGKDHGEWGFMVDGEHITSKEYFKLRNIRADGTKEMT